MPSRRKSSILIIVELVAGKPAASRSGVGIPTQGGDTTKLPETLA